MFKRYLEYISVISKTIGFLLAIAFGMTVGWLFHFYWDGFHSLHDTYLWAFWLIWLVCSSMILPIYNMVAAFLIRQFGNSRQ